jgi:hypothetical protein
MGMVLRIPILELSWMEIESQIKDQIQAQNLAQTMTQTSLQMDSNARINGINTNNNLQKSNSQETSNIKSNIHLYFADGGTKSVNYSHVQYAQQAIVVIGSEANGLSVEAREV